MKSMLSTSTSPTYLSANSFSACKTSTFLFANVCSSSSSSSSPSWSVAASNLSIGPRKLVIAAAKQNKKNARKEDSHSFVARPDEATGIFPEAVLLKEKKVQEDGKLKPEFADEEEEELFEYLNLQLESSLNVTETRHYEVVYLIHEKYDEEVGKVNEKIEAFLGEKKGKVWRFEDWGMRRLEYKIQKANRAHYFLMNVELEAKWINEFKTMLDKDERVIRHLVIKMDEAVTRVQPPPPEFHTLLEDDEDDDDDDDDDDEDEDEEDEEDEDDEDEDEEDGDEYEEDDDDGIILVPEDEDEEEETAEKRNSRKEAVTR